MKIMHLNSGKVIDNIFPYHYTWNSISGFIIVSSDYRILFCYAIDDSAVWEDITSEFDIINL